MEKKRIYDIFKEKLAPIYKDRLELVNQIDDRYFQSATGEAELLNMVLISIYLKKLSSDDELRRLHDDYFSTMYFHEGQERQLAPLRKAGWNIDFNQQNFHRLLHRFAEDAGVDGFYNALNEIPVSKAPINRIGEVKDWEEMKHSQVLSAPINAYYFKGEAYSVQHIEQKQIDSYCAKHIQNGSPILQACANRLQR